MVFKINKTMTPVEAYNLAMERIENLKKEGIVITISESALRTNPETIQKYNKPERIPPELWVHVEFNLTESDHYLRLKQLAEYLSMIGVSFDVGGYKSTRCWEFDWSFKYTGTRDHGWDGARGEVEELINVLRNEDTE